MWRDILKKKIFHSTLILILLSTIAKALSFLVRIYLGRKLSIEAMGYYSLAMPSLVFLIALAQMGIPSALSKVIASKEKPYSSIIASLILSITNNTILITLFILLIPHLSQMIFQQAASASILKAMIAMIPMVSLSGILKGILQGQQHHETACASQIFEEIFRLLYLIYVFQQGIISPIQLAQKAMFSIFIGECGSSFFMLGMMLWKQKIMIQDHNKLNKQDFIEILQLSIPMTSARFIGSLTYFIEPMIFLFFSLNKTAMTQAYGILNGYVLPLITMPSFLSLTLASMLLPSFAHEIKIGQNERAKKIFYVIFMTCLLLGLTCSLFCFIQAEFILELFYGNQQGAFYLKILSLPFAFYSLQPILSSIMHALNKSKKALFDTFLGNVLRLSLLLLTPYFHDKTLLYALSLGMLLTTSLHAYHVIVAFGKLKKNA